MQKTPLSIRIIYRLTKVLYFFSALSLLIGIIMAIALLTGLTDDVLLSVKVPTKIENAEIEKLNLLGEEMAVSAVKSVTEYHFSNNPLKIRLLFGIPMLVFLPLIFWLVSLFYRFIKNVERGKFYDVYNLKLLQKLGYGILAYWFLNQAYSAIYRLITSKEILFDGISFSSDGGDWEPATLLVALFVLTLSHIFLKGVELKEENKLTI